MGLMELGCKLEDFGRPAQPAASNRLRCRAQVVSERYLRETFTVCVSVKLLLVRGFIRQFLRVLFLVELLLSVCSPLPYLKREC